MNTVTISIILVLLVSISIMAQERRAAPAFPIGAGEKMLVIAGNSFNGERNGLIWFSWIQYDNSTHRYALELPVGTVLKRMIVNASDTDSDAAAYLHIRLTRHQNSGDSTVIMRTVNTSGISSSNSSDFKQLVSNPMNHTMLQGWNYFLEISAQNPTVINTHSIFVNCIKIIYE